MPLYELEGSRPQMPEAGHRWVAENATLIGKVRLGPDASVWFNAVLRGDNELLDIGARTNIQDGCLLHSDMGFPLTIGEDCTIGHCVILHGCTIGHNTLIGMGATLLNGARIGTNSIVGANALVTENKSFPDNVLIIGSPARVARTLEPAEIERNRATAQYYVDNWGRYARSLRRTD